MEKKYIEGGEINFSNIFYSLIYLKYYHFNIFTNVEIINKIFCILLSSSNTLKFSVSIYLQQVSFRTSHISNA